MKFAYKNYEQVIYINLANEDSLNLFEETVLSNSLHFGMINYCRKARLEEFNNSDDSILIIDEIQESAKVYNSIRALQSDLNCHIAVTGSYLGKTLNSKYFKPAGNMYEIEMLPLSFREFCRAYSLEKLLLDIDLYGNYELDFMVVDKEDKKYGIEVKASSSNKHESLDKYFDKKFIDVAYLAEITCGGIGEKIRTIPIYTVGCRFPYN